MRSFQILDSNENPVTQEFLGNTFNELPNRISFECIDYTKQLYDLVKPTSHSPMAPVCLKLKVAGLNYPYTLLKQSFTVAAEMDEYHAYNVVRCTFVFTHKVIIVGEWRIEQRGNTERLRGELEYASPRQPEVNKVDWLTNGF